MTLSQDARDQLIKLFETHHYPRHQTSLLQKTSLFLDNAQRDVRPYFYKLTDPEGAEFYLRPDFTVPVCLDYLAGLTRTDPQGFSRLSYIGPVFRWHKKARIEKLQAGIECLGAQGEHADTDILALTANALHQLGYPKFQMILGDPSLFEALVDALELEEAVRVVLKRRFLRQMFQWPMDGSAHDMTLTETPTHTDLLEKLQKENWHEATLKKSLQDQMIPLIGERSLDSIAARLRELYDRSATPPKKISSHLAQFFSVNTPPRRAIEKIARMTQNLGISLDPSLQNLTRLLDNIDSQKNLLRIPMRFATQFRGSNPGYYTGFVFSFTLPQGVVAAGGGRYDGLLKKLQNPKNLPPFGVGAALYLDSLAMTLIFAAPSKGRIGKETEIFLSACDLPLVRKTRGYTTTFQKSFFEVEVALMPAVEIAYRLQRGDIHLGITGYDLLCEIDSGDDFRHLRALKFSRAQVVVAVPKCWVDVHTMADLDDVAYDFKRRLNRRLRVATKYPRLTRGFFFKHKIIDYRLVESLGATEAAPAWRVADVIVDIKSTGKTLSDNGLKPLPEEILQSHAQLVSSKKAPWNSTARDTAQKLLKRLTQNKETLR